MESKEHVFLLTQGNNQTHQTLLIQALCQSLSTMVFFFFFDNATNF